MEKAKYLQSVRDQYEVYPYPLRNPEDERARLEMSRALLNLKTE